MRTLRFYLWREIAVATGFVLFALLTLFAFFELVNQMEEIGQAGYRVRQALIYVVLTLPSRTYELMPIAALIGTIYALSKLAANSEFTIMRVAGMSTRRLAQTVLSIGVVLVVVTYILGEFLAAPGERMARQLKLKAMGAPVAQQFRSGVWVRDIAKDASGNVERLRFVNVGRVQADASVQNWRIYEFDENFRLRSIATADSGRYLPEQKTENAAHAWELSNVVETRIPLVAADTTRTQARTEIVREAQRIWPSDLTPSIFGVLLVQPERMSAVSLVQYIQHLQDNRQQTDRYEIALWNKVFYPLAVLVMMVLALPFAYLHVRAGGVSLKIFSGVMIGVVFYMLNKLFAHLGLLNTWSPLLVSALPSLVALAAAMAALYWIERR